MSTLSTTHEGLERILEIGRVVGHGLDRAPSPYTAPVTPLLTRISRSLSAMIERAAAARAEAAYLDLARQDHHVAAELRAAAARGARD